MYAWRNMTPELRKEVLEVRRCNQLPWHSPPHRRSDRTDAYLFTAACYEHAPFIGESVDRLTTFESTLLETARPLSSELIAWVVLPNHYHFLARTPDCRAMLRALGTLHGRTSFQWNSEENSRGRRVWCGATETAMKSERHFWATINYIHYNPVKHRYVQRILDWPFSSALAFFQARGENEMRWLWKEYPIGDYGKGWDDH